MDAEAIVLESEIAAYEEQKEQLEQKHIGKWVVFRDRHVVKVFDSFAEADDWVLETYGRGPCLVRRVGAGPRMLPSSLWPRPHVS